MAQPEITFVFLFLVELALLFLCLVVFDFPGFHCFRQTSLHFPPRWFPCSFLMNHLIAKSYRFPLKSAISLQLPPSSSPIPQRLHSPLWLSLFSMQLQSISWSTWPCSRRHAVFSLCKHPSATSVLFRLSLSSGTIVHHLPAFPSQHVLSLEFYLNHLIQFLQLNIIDSADFHCVGCNRYNLQFIALIRLASLSSVFAIFSPSSIPLPSNTIFVQIPWTCSIPRNL